MPEAVHPGVSSTFQLGGLLRVSVDEEAGAVYLHFGGEVEKTVEVSALLLIDLDRGNNVVGIEVLPDNKEVLKYFRKF